MTRTIRPIRIEGNVAFVPLARGYTAIIDAADVHLVDKWNWCASVEGYTVYAVRGDRAGGQYRSIRLHRVIMDAPDDLEVDHRSGDGLDCRRVNMRLATRSQNGCNQRLSRANTSGFKGVSWDSRNLKWLAPIAVGGKRICLGRFITPESAHAAYSEASARLHGDYGRLV